MIKQILAARCLQRLIRRIQAFLHQRAIMRVVFPAEFFENDFRPSGTGDLTHNYDAELGLPNPFGVGGGRACTAPALTAGNGFEWETQNTNAANEFYGILDDNATKVKGKHEFQFGFHYRFDQMDILPAQQQVAGNDNFATNATALYDPSSSRTNPQALPYTGDNLANFYLGVANYSNQYVRGCFMRAPRNTRAISRISTR